MCVLDRGSICDIIIIQADEKVKPETKIILLEVFIIDKIKVSDYEEVPPAAAKHTGACKEDRKVYPACRKADLVVPALPLYDQAHHPVIFSLQVMRRRSRADAFVKHGFELPKILFSLKLSLV